MAALGVVLLALLFLAGMVLCFAGLLIWILYRIARRDRPRKKAYTVLAAVLFAVGVVLTLPMVFIRLQRVGGYTDYGGDAWLYLDGKTSYIEYDGENYYSLTGFLGEQEDCSFRVDTEPIQTGEPLANVKDSSHREWPLVFGTLDLIFGEQDHGALLPVENPGGKGILMCGNGLYCREERLEEILAGYKGGLSEEFPYNVIIACDNPN